jgi:hypothetical protein
MRSTTESARTARRWSRARPVALLLDDVQSADEVLQRLADRTTDRTDATVMRFLGGAALVLGDFPSSSAYLADAAAAYRAEGRLGLLARALRTRARVSSGSASWDQVLANLDEASRLAAETGEQFSAGNGSQDARDGRARPWRTTLAR